MSKGEPTEGEKEGSADSPLSSHLWGGATPSLTHTGSSLRCTSCHIASTLTKHSHPLSVSHFHRVCEFYRVMPPQLAVQMGMIRS